VNCEAGNQQGSPSAASRASDVAEPANPNRDDRGVGWIHLCSVMERRSYADSKQRDHVRILGRGREWHDCVHRCVCFRQSRAQAWSGLASRREHGAGARTHSSTCRLTGLDPACADDANALGNRCEGAPVTPRLHRGRFSPSQGRSTRFGLGRAGQRDGQDAPQILVLKTKDGILSESELREIVDLACVGSHVMPLRHITSCDRLGTAVCM
jgi:hypothetical protein